MSEIPKYDLLQADMIIINYPRHAATINKIKKYLGTKVRRPILIAGISTQEGLMNIDDFVKVRYYQCISNILGS